MSIRTKDEIRDTAEAFNSMVTAVRHIILTSKQTADQVAVTSDQIVHIADQTMTGNKQLAVSMQETSKGAELQMFEHRGRIQGTGRDERWVYKGLPNPLRL